jgi:excisionase family DNA binding protein
MTSIGRLGRLSDEMRKPDRDARSVANPMHQLEITTSDGLPIGWEPHGAHATPPSVAPEVSKERTGSRATARSASLRPAGDRTARAETFGRRRPPRPTEPPPVEPDATEVATLVERLAPLVAAKLEASVDERPHALLTPREAAQRAHVHVETIRRNVRSGALRASRAGRAVRIAPASLDTWLASAGTDRRRSRPRRPRARPGRRPLADALASLDAVSP